MKSENFGWLPATLEQLNILHEKAPFVVNSCLLMICSAPFLAALSMPLFALRKGQNKAVINTFRDQVASDKD